MSNFTSNGYVRRTPSQIKQSLADYMTQNNPTYQEYAADVQNNLLDTGVAKISEIENICSDCVNSFGPAFSDVNSFMWEQQAASLNLKYKDATQASVTLKFTGDPGTYIPIDTEVKNGFKTTASLTLDTTGVGYVRAESDSDATYEAGEIDEIVTNVAANLTVTNPAPTIPYKDAETNEELKIRAQRLLRSARIGGCDYAITQLTALEGVAERLVNFTFISSATRRGVEAIVGGGNTNEVANALFNCFMNTGNLVSEPSDNETDRTATFNINYYGSTLPIVWTIPKELKLRIKLTLTFRYVNVYSGTLQENLQKTFEAYLNKRKVGLPLNKNALNELIYDNIKAMDVELQYLSQITYEIRDYTGVELQWDTYGYLESIKKDVYTRLIEFSLELRYD